MPIMNEPMSFSLELTPGESFVDWDFLVNALDAVPFSEPNCSAEEAVPDDDQEEAPAMLDFVPRPKPVCVESVIFSGPATTIIWSDNVKTTVKVSEGQEFDRYAGFCAAFVKRVYGSTSAAKREMDKADVELQRQARAAEKEARRKKQQEDGVKARKKKAMSVVPSLEEFERLAYERAVDKVVDRLASDMAGDLGDLITRKRAEAAIKGALADKEEEK